MYQKPPHLLQNPNNHFIFYLFFFFLTSGWSYSKKQSWKKNKSNALCNCLQLLMSFNFTYNRLGMKSHTEGKQDSFKIPHRCRWHIYPPDSPSSKFYTWILFFPMSTILNQQTNPSWSFPHFSDLPILFISTFLISRLESCTQSPAGSPWGRSPSHPCRQTANRITLLNLFFQKPIYGLRSKAFWLNVSFLSIQNHHCLIPQKSRFLSWNEIQSAWCSSLVNSHICVFFLHNSTFSTFCQYVFIFLQNPSPGRLSCFFLCQLLQSTSVCVCMYVNTQMHTYTIIHMLYYDFPLADSLRSLQIFTKYLVNVFINSFTRYSFKAEMDSYHNRWQTHDWIPFQQD